MNTSEDLSQQFLKGTCPKSLDGFYHGKLLELFPINIPEFLGDFVSKVWLPWYGKQFDSKNNNGNNVIPSYLSPLVTLRYGEKIILKKDSDTIHVLPFKTKITKGINDNINVLQLDYDIPENPEQVRTVVDELVKVAKNKYLGKAYLREDNTNRLVAFFSLEK